MRKDIVEGLLVDVEKTLPVAVMEWIVETGPDATGEEAVWVWAVLRDEDLNRGNRMAIQKRITEEVWGAFRNRWSERELPWVYVLFRALSEQQAHGAA